MVQYGGKHISKYKKLAIQSVEKKSEVKLDFDEFMICDDCGHNTLRFEPAKDGACFCGCH
ncbi:MAG TPA: hypothetical protein VF884_09155 [Nitrososphaeraceae archaeon]